MTGVVAYRYMSVVNTLYLCWVPNRVYEYQLLGTVSGDHRSFTRFVKSAHGHCYTERRTGWSVLATGTTRARLHGVSGRGQCAYQTTLARRANGRWSHCTIGSTNEALDRRNGVLWPSCLLYFLLGLGFPICITSIDSGDGCVVRPLDCFRPISTDVFISVHGYCVFPVAYCGSICRSKTCHLKQDRRV